MHPAAGYALPRLFRHLGQTMSLQQALRRGVSPLELLVEDGAGGWQKYIEPRLPAQPRRERRAAPELRVAG